jgi:hypothetical protein
MSRTGNPTLPEMPIFLQSLASSERAKSIMWKFDVMIDEDTWANAFDVDDHFNFDLRGEHEVMRFATQGTGSIFGFLVGTR